MNFQISATPKRVTRFLLIIVGFLVICGIASNYLHVVMGLPTALGLIPLFNLDWEWNVPAFYSAFAIWFSAALLWFIYKHHKKEGHPRAAHWKMLCFVFLYLGMDEVAVLHEKFDYLAPLVAKVAPSLQMSRKWILPLLPLLIAFGVYFFRFYQSLPGTTRLRFTVAGIVFVSGAIGLELFGEWYITTYTLPVFYQRFFSVAEEALEMVGIVLFIRALLFYIQSYVQPAVFNLQIVVPPNKSAAETKSGETTPGVRKVAESQPSKTKA